jgi:hypothetical protein
MPDPSLLTPSAVARSAPETHDAVVNQDATVEGQEITCVIPEFDPLIATDPMPWNPLSTPAGWFYPKRGDRALLCYPVDGDPVILEWWRNATEPDVPLI